MARRKTIGIKKVLTSLLPRSTLDKAASAVGLTRRHRKVSVHALFWTLVLGFGAARRRSSSSTCAATSCARSTSARRSPAAAAGTLAHAATEKLGGATLSAPPEPCQGWPDDGVTHPVTRPIEHCRARLAHGRDGAGVDSLGICHENQCGVRAC